MKKILVIRFSSIGDIVLTTPVVRCLRQSLRDVEIHYLTKTAFRFIADSNPVIDKVYSFDNRLKEVIPLLRQEKYDLIIDLHNNLRSALVKVMLRRPYRTFPKLNLRKWLLVKMKWDTLPRRHIVDRYFSAVESLGIRNDQQGLDFFIPVRDRVNTTELFGIEPGTYIVLVAGAAHFTKRIPIEKMVEICNRIKHPLVVLGGEQEQDTGQKLAEQFPGKVHNLCGQLNLARSASVLKQAKHVITADTGLMHIAAAFQKPITVLWGNTVPQFGMYPYLTETSWQSLEVRDLTCRPCSKIGYDHCPKGHFKCMMDQDISQIAI